jgi:hypothetical protein
MKETIVIKIVMPVAVKTLAAITDALTKLHGKGLLMQEEPKGILIIVKKES